MVSVSLDCWCKAGLENLIRLAKKEALFIRKHPKVCYSLWHHPSRWQLQIWAGADQGWVEGRRRTVRLSRSQGGSQSPPILLFFPLWWPPSRVPRFPPGSGCTWDQIWVRSEAKCSIFTSRESHFHARPTVWLVPAVPETSTNQITPNKRLNKALHVVAHLPHLLCCELVLDARRHLESDLKCSRF